MARLAASLALVGLSAGTRADPPRHPQEAYRASLRNLLTPLENPARRTERIAPPAADARLPRPGPAIGQRAPQPATDVQKLDSQQSVIEQEYAELERRMLRLSNSLKPGNPEQASRLLDVLQYARAAGIRNRIHVLRESIGRMELTQATESQEAVLREFEQLRSRLHAKDENPAQLMQQLQRMRQLRQQLDQTVEREQQAIADNDALQQGSLDSLAREEALADLQQRESQNQQLTEQLRDLAQTLASRATESSAESLDQAAKHMGAAAKQLRQKQLPAARSSQDNALEQLASAKQDLDSQQRSLQEAMTPEVQRKVMQGLKILLDGQMEIRRACLSHAKHERYAEICAELATRQRDLATITFDLVTLVEATRFGVALPAALQTVGRTMTSVGKQLSAAQPVADHLPLQRQIESDLTMLMDAMQHLSAAGSKSGAPEKKSSQQRIRELNRLAAELQMLRRMQQGLLDRTLETEDMLRRTHANPLDMSDQKQALQRDQHRLYEVTQELLRQRGAELPTPFENE